MKHTSIDFLGRSMNLFGVCPGGQCRGMILRSYRASRQTRRREFESLFLLLANYEKRHTNLCSVGNFVAFSTLDISFYYRYNIYELVMKEFFTML